ncbi:MAG: twin-arginine translocase TatA/TatE family subunit [Thermincola sp.]|jgi:sec-independent protein translocase protein TatA|nr:twin-arginine translocase TatA/TatE family subunit [Thermincola sp.]MDT3703971.1 twin-arginine translocase TatA/TatE family subunit [Thermincola sp.]
MYFGFFNLGPLELIAIMLIVLLIFGPKKLPQIGRSFGEMLSNFRKGSNSDKDETEQPEDKEK